MSSGFEINELLYPITKGDLSGHPFHGNQYASVASLANRASGLKKEMLDHGYGNNSPKDFANAHREIALQHQRLSDAYSDKFKKLPWGDKDRNRFLALAGAHAEAAQAHLEASKAHNWLASHGSEFGHEVSGAEARTAEASSKSAKALDLSNRLEKSYGSVLKGDVAGHPFHGNQYEAGQGGGGNLTPSGHRPLSEIARDVEKVWSANSKKGVYFGAKPYLDALKQLHDIKDNYMFDSAKSVVNYLLSNMGTFRGEGAPALKNELKALVK